jgi:hypothetical protein
MTTKTKAPSAADELDTLEQGWADAKAEADNLGRDFHDRRARAQDLLELRRHRIHRDPGLVDHRNQPVDPDGEIAQIDRDVAALGDLVDLHAQFDHARTLEESAKRACYSHIETHFDDLVEALRPRAEAAVASVRDKADEMLEAIGEYRAVHGRAVWFTEPIRSLDGRNVPGINTVSNLMRTLETIDLPTPLPNPERRFA